MEMMLMIVGVILIGGSYFFKPSKNSEYEGVKIENFQADFYDQFEMSQQKLESLYAFDFSEVCTKLEEIEYQIQKLQDTVEQLPLNEMATAVNHLNPMLENLSTINDETKRKILKYSELKNQGKSLDEMVKLLQMEKGELLFLENLSKTIMNS